MSFAIYEILGLIISLPLSYAMAHVAIKYSSPELDLMDHPSDRWTRRRMLVLDTNKLVLESSKRSDGLGAIRPCFKGFNEGIILNSC